MRVLDLRHGAVRRWHARGVPVAVPAGMGPWWQRVAGGLVDGVQALRVAARPQPPDTPRVVAVGNLALGGTGKTPVVARLAADLAAAGHAGCVLTRGYGSPRPGPLRVDPADAGAGDEARMLAAMLAPAGWPVVQARRRARGLAWIRREMPGVAVVLLEDAHQTAVGRHLDVLIVDAWQERDGALVPCTGPVFPLGPWRESARGAARADVVLVEAEAPPARTAAGQPVAGFRRTLRLDAPAGARSWAAVSGVARPERFEDDAARLLGAAPRLVVRCDDHAAYGAALRARITAELREAGSPLVVTTRKDWTKLERGWPPDLPVAVADQELVWTGAQALPALVGERLRP